MTIQLKTITQALVEARQRPVTQIAFRYSDGAKWHDVSWPDYYKMAERVGAGLASLGFKRGDRVAIMSNTRYQWALSDLAILGVGGVTVPIYQNSTEEDATFILENSEAVIAFVEDEGQLLKARQAMKTVKSLKHIVSFTSVDDKDAILFSDLMKRGADHIAAQSDFFEKECLKNKLSDHATIVYTSGTTGQPKGVLLLHECIASECQDIQALLKFDDKDATLTFLPFAHIFGRVEMWANVYIGWKMCLAESIDRISANLLEIKPTFMMAVPRIFEKIYARILSQIDEGSPIKKKIFSWASHVGSQVSQHKRKKEDIPLALLLQYRLAYKLVFAKINKALGGRIRFLVSGGAPLAKEIAEFFHAADVLILEGYGLTETTAAVAVNTPYRYRFGTVGPMMGEAEAKIAEDGEILIRSKKVFAEYFRNSEATKESLNDRWFHTGDIGQIDADGFLQITDRKKDLIKTAGGKMIAPQKLENLLKTNKYISQVLVCGDKMKYLVVLVTLNPDEIKKFASHNGITFKDLAELTKNQKVHDLVGEIIKEKNASLAHFETIKNFAVLPTEFTIEGGELTPSMKIKRKHLTEKYAAIINKLYS